MVIPRSGQSIYRRCLDYHELTKTRRIVNALTTEIDSIVVFSETDMHKVQNARGTVNIIPPGLDAPTTTWSRGHSHLAVFGGAMWRLENEATAIYLAQQVMPLVRKSVPDAELRIFGARPSQAVRALGRQPGITITGEVADYDAEFRHAQVALAPSMVEAGILIKSLRAMAMGCPVVLNRASARPLTGLQPGTQALVGDSPSEIAEHIVGLMLDGARAQRIGNSARSFVSANYGWDRSATAYLAAFEKLATAGTQSAQRGSGRR
ncbi:glycosyltransferase [Mycobacterium sp. SM3041]|uniref:glycosyltransferase family 4 protein n=1 Tax=Mycobacterium sp. SM3041 TaxID=3114291 RepID=UPI003204C253